MGEMCFICNQNDHSFAHCPKTHYVIKEQIATAEKIEKIIKQKKYQQNRESRNRRTINSKKIKNIAHPMSVWSKFKKSELGGLTDIVNKVLIKSIKQFALDNTS